MTTVRLGTRSSPLALVQARLARDAIIDAGSGEVDVVLVPIATTGDRDGRPLRDIGARGLFAAELEGALLDGRIDAGVHSCKDLALEPSEGLRVAACLPRADARDALCGTSFGALHELPSGARIAAGSARRAALVRALRDDVEVVALRGNVQTRLQRAQEQGLDAVVLAAAGMHRLGLEREVGGHLPLDLFVPEPAQGAIAIQVADGDESVDWTLVDDAATSSAVAIERAVALRLSGGCTNPLGVHVAPAIASTGATAWLFAARADGSRARWHSVDVAQLEDRDRAVDDLVAAAHSQDFHRILEYSTP